MHDRGLGPLLAVRGKRRAFTRPGPHAIKWQLGLSIGAVARYYRPDPSDSRAVIQAEVFDRKAVGGVSASLAVAILQIGRQQGSDQ